MFKRSRLVKCFAALLGLSMLPVLASPALAASVDDDRWVGQQLINSDATAPIGSVAFAHTRPTYFSDTDGSVPAGERFAALGYNSVPSFFYLDETTERQLRFTNTTDAAFTVSGLSARTVLPDLPGESRTLQVVSDGTNVADKPLGDVVVPAGQSVIVEFSTTDSLISTVRTNSEGRLTGMGTVTRFTATIEGREYSFTETDAFGSVNNIPYFTPNPALSNDDFYGDCEQSSVPDGDLGICSFFGNSIVSIDASFYNFVPPVTPVPEPETPTVPEVPTEPETPTVPEVPTEPETPTVPEVPTEPEVPTVPEVPTEPETPTVPEVPTEPETPAVLIPEPEVPTPSVPASEVPTSPESQPVPETAPVPSSAVLPKTGTDTVSDSLLAGLLLLIIGASLFVTKKALLKRN